LSTVLVTGGSGFIGSHCIVQLLATGHQVRTTVRDLTREGKVRAMLQEGGARRGAPGVAQLTRSRSQADGSDLLFRGGRLCPEAAESALQRLSVAW
jgi:nucleoside-diphosphate-sugar epimerase